MGKYGALLFLILSSILLVVPSLCEVCCHQHALETLTEMIKGENVRDCFGDLPDIRVAVTGECPFGDMSNVNVDSLRIYLQYDIARVVFPSGTLEIVVRNKFEIIGEDSRGLPRLLSSNGTTIKLVGHASLKPEFIIENVNVTTGVSFVTESFFSVEITGSVFLHEKGQTVLNLMAGASLALNPGDSKTAVTLRCISCSEPSIIARICGDSSISFTVLEKSGQKNNTVPVIKFLPCDEDTERPPSLEILGITYIGNIPDEVDAAWIAVRGDHRNGPKIILPNDTHVGKVFKFTITENATVISKFEVLEKGSGIETGRTDEMGLKVKIPDEVRYSYLREKWWYPVNTGGYAVCFRDNHPIRTTAIFTRQYLSGDMSALGGWALPIAMASAALAIL